MKRNKSSCELAILYNKVPHTLSDFKFVVMNWGEKDTGRQSYMHYSLLTLIRAVESPVNVLITIVAKYNSFVSYVSIYF